MNKQILKILSHTHSTAIECSFLSEWNCSGIEWSVSMCVVCKCVWKGTAKTKVKLSEIWCGCACGMHRVWLIVNETDDLVGNCLSKYDIVHAYLFIVIVFICRYVAFVVGNRVTNGNEMQFSVGPKRFSEYPNEQINRLNGENLKMNIASIEELNLLRSHRLKYSWIAMPWRIFYWNGDIFTIHGNGDRVHPLWHNSNLICLCASVSSS